MSRNYHAVTAEYNILFNGNEALNAGVKQLDESFVDNYWEILPVEKFEANEALSIATTSDNPSFARAEEKAVKAIQKHAINIKGRESNPQMDEAYLLLGKSRYYDQRFIPSQEAFNYILYRYPASDKINEAKIWKEKTNLRLQNEELVVQNVKKLIENDPLDKQELADANALLAQAYINLGVLDSGAIALKKAAILTKSNTEKGRYYYITGQIYNVFGVTDSANFYFDQVIDLNRKIDRAQVINAQLENAKIYQHANLNDTLFLEQLNKLERDRESRPYLGRIYNTIGNYYSIREQGDKAIAYYNKSLRVDNTDPILNFKNYSTLAELYFDNKSYVASGAYYDSTLVNLKDDTKLFRDINRKRENLEDVITYENTKVRNDSILSVVAMPEDQQRLFFQTYIDQLKANAADSIAKTATTTVRLGSASLLNNTPNTNRTTSSRFYFYNPQTVAYGKNEFRRNWGDRPLSDNWRWASVNYSQNKISLTQTETEANPYTEAFYTVDYYTNQLPTQQTEIDSIVKERNFAYYQLGVLYNEKFNDLELAKQHLNAVIAFSPEPDILVPSYYNLYKIHQKAGDISSAEEMKSRIVTNHPETRYAKILLNPSLGLANQDSTLENAYEALYKLFQEQDYQAVINGVESNLNRSDNKAISSKLELLKATAIGRLNGYEAYKEAINFVALTYPNTEAGKNAQSLSDEVLPQLEDKSFVDDSKAAQFKVVFEFLNENEATAFLKTINTILPDLKFGTTITASKDVYTSNAVLVVLHGFSSKAIASEFKSVLKPEQQNAINKTYVVMSSENYRSVQIHKHLNAYKDQL